MSLETSTEQKGKAGRGLMVAAVVGVISLAAAGTMFMSHESDAEPAKKGAAAAKSETGGVEKIAPASADTPAASTAGQSGTIQMGDPVVAEVGGEKVLRSEVFSYISTLPEQIRQMPLQTLFPLALDQVLNARIIGMKADQAKMDSDPEVTKLLETAKGQIVRNVYVERELNKAVSQKDLLKAYETMLEGFEKVEEVRARHILVAEEDKARDIIAKLDGGAKFEDLTAESADTPTAQNGGDLGYFAKTEMVPEFAEAAFNITPGSYSKTPVKTQFGWHVVKVEEKRQRPEPQFELVKPQLEAQVRREQLNRMLEKWQKEASIKKFDINGEPIKTETPPAKKK